MISAIWLSYDLGVNGDYEGLYTWLADQGAKECGSSMAFLNFEHEEEDELLASLKEDIEEVVKLTHRSRIYVVFRSSEKIRGLYLIGKRKSAPWIGYESIAEDDYDESR